MCCCVVLAYNTTHPPPADDYKPPAYSLGRRPRDISSQQYNPTSPPAMSSHIIVRRQESFDVLYVDKKLPPPAGSSYLRTAQQNTTL